MTAEAWFTLRADGTIGAISYAGPLTLAMTGVEAAPLLAGGALLLTIGALLTALGARRRMHA